MFKNNCCDGLYHSYDVHFTSCCDNNCSFCIDKKYDGLGIKKPEPQKIAKTIIDGQEGFDDVLFLGGEPCLYLKELIECIETIKANTKLKCFVTTSMPKTCYDNKELFFHLIDICDGINISAQHHNQEVADEIRRTKSQYDRIAFYKSLPHKEKFRINLNINKPYLYKKEDLIECLKFFDDLGFPEIKLSEIQHGTEYFVSFEKIFGIKLKSPFSHGCQTWVDMKPWIPDFKGKLLLKRSCFLCESTLKASFMDGVKAVYRSLVEPDVKYGVVYEDGTLSNGGWL